MRADGRTDGRSVSVGDAQVCREWRRGACSRGEASCRFAHPPARLTPHDDGCVTACMDAVRGRCARDPCRYFHPPLHLQAHLKTQARAAVRSPDCTLSVRASACARRPHRAASSLTRRFFMFSSAVSVCVTLPSHSRFIFVSFKFIL